MKTLDLEQIAALADRLEKLNEDGVHARMLALEQANSDLLEQNAKIVALLTKLAPDIAKGVQQGLSEIKMPAAAPQITFPKIDFPDRAKHVTATPEFDQRGRVVRWAFDID